jgi:hypothetical protein
MTDHLAAADMALRLWDADTLARRILAAWQTRDPDMIEQIGKDFGRLDVLDLAALAVRQAETARALIDALAQVYDLTPEQVIDRVIDA